MQDNNDSWTDIGSAMTAENGRVESFGQGPRRKTTGLA
jgi:5-hydroxyisourate hydrolase